MKRTVLIVGAALGVAFAGSAAARPCVDDDVRGTWSLQSIRAAEPGVQAFYAQAPHEYMRLGAGGDYVYVARTQPLTGAAAIAAALDRIQQQGGGGLIARTPEPGVLVIYRNGEPFQAFTCAVRNDGAMVWTEYPGLPDLERVHRRVR